MLQSKTIKNNAATSLVHSGHWCTVGTAAIYWSWAGEFTAWRFTAGRLSMAGRFSTLQDSPLPLAAAALGAGRLLCLCGGEALCPPE